MNATFRLFRPPAASGMAILPGSACPGNPVRAPRLAPVRRVPRPLSAMFRAATLLALLAAGPAPFLAGCGERLAGGGNSSETPNTVTGRIVGPGGESLAGDTVRLRPARWIAGRPPRTGSGIIDAATDKDGSFRLEGMPKGAYVIEIRGDSLGLARELSVGGRTTLATDTARAYATIEGAVTGARSARIALLGSERLASTRSDGSFRIERVAPGAWTLAALADSLDVALRAETRVATLPGDTARIGDLRPDPAGAEDYATWSRKRTAVIDLTPTTGVGVTGDHPGFPLLVVLDASNFDFAASDGSDLRFSGDHGLHLPYEIERWDAAARQAWVWVRLDTIHGSSREHSLTMHWGKPGAVGRSDGRAVFDSANGYLAAWHLDGAAPRQDALGRTPIVPSRATAIASPAGLGVALAGDGHLRAGDSIGLDRQELTISFWLRLDEPQWSFLAGLDTSSDSAGWQVRLLSDGRIRAATGLPLRGDTADTPLGAGRWTLVAASFDRATQRIRLYNDTAAAPRVTVPFLPPSGSRRDFLAGTGLRGALDEIRISAVVRSPSWIRLEYENLTRPKVLVQWD